MSTIKAHEKIEKKNGITTDTSCLPKKGRVDKKKLERMKAEKTIAEGGNSWRKFTEAKGFDKVERHDPCLMFQVYGPAPDPDANSSSSEDEQNSKNHSDDSYI